MLHVDLPSPTDLCDLARHRGGHCVTICLPTTPRTQEAQADRIALKNLAKEAIDRLEAAGAGKREFAELSEELDDLIDDDEFWRFQAHGLVIFATPENLRTFRVPTALEPGVTVGDRFRLAPLLRATTFHHSGYVLALAAGSVRLVEVSADLPAVAVAVNGLPNDAASAARQSSIAGRQHRGRLVGTEGQKVRLRQYCRKIDGALRGLLSGCDTPLVLASVDMLADIYRSVNSHPRLADARIETSPERVSEADLAAAARPIFDAIDAARMENWRGLFAQRLVEHRASADIAQVARAATYGLVQSLLVDMNDSTGGTIDEATGAVAFDRAASPTEPTMVDELARRVLLAGGEVLSVRSEDIPDGKPLAAIFRYKF